MTAFQELMRALGREIGIALDGEMTGQVEITIDGLAVTLALNGRAGIEDLVLSSRLGVVPPESELDIYRLMLDANVLWTATADCTLGVNADTREAVICFRSEIERLDGPRAATLLAGFVEIARNWANLVAAAGEAPDLSASSDDGFRESLIRV